GYNVIATPSPAPSGAVSDNVNTSPRSAVPAGTATRPDAPCLSTHASQAFPAGGAGRRTIRYADPRVGITTEPRASGFAPDGASATTRPSTTPPSARPYSSAC